MRYLVVKFFITVFCCLSMDTLAHGQKNITSHINERDSVFYHEGSYAIERLEMKNTESILFNVMEELSVNDSCEMYIVRIGNKKIAIQNWEYRGIRNLKSTNIYGMFRIKGKDFLICYNNSGELKSVRKLYSKKKEKISFKIQYKRLPDDFYIIQNDIVTLYKGILDHNDILIQEKTYNNRRIK